ncbi:MAG: phosphoenolpyruvate carboxylase [Sphingomonadales bacterium]|jgi:phosphoenolpyruvate carboxylase
MSEKQLLAWTAERWSSAKKAATYNPLNNPMLETALSLNDELDAKQFNAEEVEAAVQNLTIRALQRRVERSRAYLGPMDKQALGGEIDALVDNLLYEDGKERSFPQFSALLEREALGLVITAHPTFSMTPEIMDDLVSGIENGGQAEFETLLKNKDLRPNLEITLQDEREMAGRALANAQLALCEIYDAVLRRAEKIHGSRVWRLRPKLATVASWVGYDLDGRSDIDWATSLRFRYLSAAEQAALYRDEWAKVLKGWDSDKARDVGDALKELSEIYGKISAVVPENASDLDQVRHLSQLSVEYNPRRKELISLVDRLLSELAKSSEGSSRSSAITLFAARFRTNGFGLNHVHFRLNAAQLHNAVRPAVAMESAPDAASNRRRYLGALAQLLDNVEPTQINYGSLMKERTTARRLFMLLAQIIKFIDDKAPIRLLIAESDTPFTVLTALYYARLFGIEDKVEICPLFETDAGLERGARVIAELLEDPHYSAYVRAQGRLCVQAGYSDAGRYMGQIAAGLAIERFRVKLAQLWPKYDLGQVELVIFDTHGESVGRGAHPEGIAERLSYVQSDYARAIFKENSVCYKQEISLQGGDGYVWLWTKELAQATLCRMLSRAVCGSGEKESVDPFYVDTDYSLDFFLTIKEFQNRTVNDPDYLPMLTGFGVNLLYPSGSRMTLRQRESGAVTRATHVGQIRAIPHNAILQQMGFMANSLGGMGTAIAKDRERYTEIRDASQRLQKLRSMVRHAAQFSELKVFESYLSLFDPETWLHYAAGERSHKRQERMQRVSEHLERMSVDVDHGHVIRAFWKDYNDLMGALEWQVPTMFDDGHEDLVLIHVLRLALIQRLFLLAARVPRFSSRPNLTIEEVIEQLLRLNVAGALEILREVFPIEPESEFNGEFGEPATFHGDAARGYSFENKVVFDQIEQLYDLIRRLGVATLHYIGAYG